MAIEVHRQLQDVIDHIDRIVARDTLGQIFEDDLHQVAQLFLQIPMVLNKVGHAVGVIVLSVLQRLDVTEHRVVLVPEVCQHLVAIDLKESAEHHGHLVGQMLSNVMQVPLDVRQLAVDVVVVRITQIGHQSAHVGIEY